MPSSSPTPAQSESAHEHVWEKTHDTGGGPLSRSRSYECACGVSKTITAWAVTYGVPEGTTL